MELSPCEDLFICPTGFGVNWGMKIMIEFMIKGKQVTVMPATEPDKPVVYLNTFANEVNSVYKNLQALCCPDFNLVAISKLKWDHDMTPWYMPPISKRDAPCTGGADDYLRLMIEEIIPKAEKKIADRGVRVTTGRVIAEQTLGFWNSFYETHHYALLAGVPCRIFKKLPPGFGRKEINDIIV